MKKNVRKVPRIAIVPMVAAVPTRSETFASNHARMPLVANWIASAISGGIDTDANWVLSAVTPAVRLFNVSAMYGTNAIAMTTIVAMITAIAPRKTTAAALIRDQPRSRSASTNGANVAATIAATRIEAVTVNSVLAIRINTS